ncbi:MAG TPA: GTPase Era [Coriobacteriia bacterium]
MTGADPMAEVHSGFVALVGRPNAGKSTLVNALVGSKVAIVSDKPQTTRHRLRAIVDTDDAQIVLVDTPGLHKPHDALGEELNKSALMALRDVDVVAMVVDLSQPVGGGDRWVATHVAAASAKRVLVLTKADLPNDRPIEKRIADAAALLAFDDIVVLSAKEGFNLEGFTAVIGALLPMGPRFFPRDMTSDQPEEVVIAELIREKVLWHTRDEVPHSVGAVIDDLRYDEDNDTTTVHATIFVERDSQQGIIVGTGGSMVKRIGTEARKDLETLFGTKVYLDLAVRVKKDWRSDGAMIKRFGYGEGL